MKIQCDDHERITVIHLNGNFTESTVERFRRTCAEHLRQGREGVILDLEAMHQIDSCGLEQLLWLHDQLEERGGAVRLVNPVEIVCTILRITRLDRCFDIHASIESAAKSLRMG